MINSNLPSYEPISLRGSGAFGYVIEAYDKVHDARVAIKRTHKVGNKVSREYEVLSKIKDCEYVVKLLDTFYSVNDEGKVIQNLVFEYVSRSLEGYLEDCRDKGIKIPIEKIRQIAKQVLIGLNYCHSKNIVHRDLKPENILFTQDNTVKICDFGSSKFIYEDTKSTPYIVSRYYRAPELLLGMNNYNEKIDIFAFGCIFAELFTLTPLFPGKTEGMQLFEHMAILGAPKEGFFKKFENIPQNYINYFDKINEVKSCNLIKLLNGDNYYEYKDIKDASDLLIKLITWDPNDRISADKALTHKFFKI